MQRKKILATVLVLVLIAAVAVGLVFHHRQQQEDLRSEMLEELEQNAGQYDEQSIVLYNTSKAKAEELAELYGAALRITKDGRFATLTLPEGTTIRDVYAMDESLAHIDDMTADYQVQVSDMDFDEGDDDHRRLPHKPSYSVSDQDYELQSYLDYLNMGNVWDYYTGSGITVAVIDTGIDTDHPEFAGRISEYSYNATEDKIVKDYLLSDGSYDWSLIEDEQGHGTAVTGVIAASMNSGSVVGIAPNVNIIVIKAECDEQGNFYRTSDLVFGIYYAVERDVQVVNMSFGVGSPTNPFAEATQLAYESDVICVAAAGNDATSALTWPAADENVIGVGALGDGWDLADYSNFGENTDLVAPGSTYTCKMGGGYASTQGTSLASPIVTGAIALMLQNNPYTTFDAVTELLYASCYDLGDLGRDWYYGFGALDVSAFLLEARGTITYDMLTDELENLEGVYIQGHTLQELPEPERLYAVFDGWYYDDTFTQEYNYYEDKFYGEELTLYAKWANEDDGVPYTYVILEDGTVEIRSYTGHRRFITIPEKIEGRAVSSIGDFAFSGQTRLREVTLPAGLTHIGLNAFENCANLISIQIPANVTEIEAYAFSNNVRLSSIAFMGNKLESIGAFAFQNCARLERIELPVSLRNMDGSVFYGATALKSISVQRGNTAFRSQDGVLFNLSGSTLVAFPAAWGNAYTLPAETTYIGNYAFAFSSLEQIDLAQVAHIGDSAFAYASLENLTIPDGVTALGQYAFYRNENLAQLTIGRGLSKISMYAFGGTTSLHTVTIPNTVFALEGCAFNGSGLQRVIFEEISTLQFIGNNAFFDCNISEIDIPASVIQIGEGAFSGGMVGNPLVRVGFAENNALQTIGRSAFANCRLLESIQLPAGLRTIGSFAFQYSGLTQITVPASVTELGDGVFANCAALTAVMVEAGNTVYHDVDGVVYTLDNTAIHTYPAGKAGENYTLLTTTEVVAPWAFAGAVHLTTAQLPESLAQISEYGFADCTKLQYIHIPDNVLQIGRYAFSGDWNLYSVSFNETSKLPRISFGAFAHCGLQSFTVPANVSTIAQKAFEGCSNLTSFTFAANSKLESISAYMFDGCTNLQCITFLPGSSLKSIQAHGLEGMDKLYSIDFGDAKLTNVDNFAFRFCESLSALTLPETVTNIGRYAFYGCKNLSQLTIPKNVEHIGSYAFLGTADLELYFVAENLPAYLDENWDHGTKGYYTGVTSVQDNGTYRYAVLESGNIAILAYLGQETSVDLTKADLGAPITIIGGSAFEGSAVQTIVLPDTLTAIQAEAFAYSDLMSIAIPANVTFIGRQAFAHTDIQALTFAVGSQLKVMEQYAFEGTEYLTAVTLPASLTTLGTGVFQESGLQTVTFEPGIRITEIPQQAFANTKLTAVSLPDSVTLVNHNAFNNVQTLKSVTFGQNDGIRLMSNAFYHTGLETLHIPANVTYIGEYCFVALTELTEYTVDETNPNYASVDGLLLDKSGRKLIAVPAGRTGSLTVPAGVEEIGFGAFEESKLSQILFPEDANILTFGYRAFFKANNIATITIPASVVSIDYYAFAYCENLQEVIFAEDNQLKGIYEGAFLGCMNLESIVLPDSIVEISDFAFYGCGKITRLPISENNAIKGIYDYAFAYTGLSGEFTTPETLIDIGNYAFLGTKLTKVTIPDTNKKDLVIGLGAFEDCNQLEEITLPFLGTSFEDEKISWLGYIFGAGSYQANETYVPESLKTVTLTEGITTIYTGGFAYCTGLETINVPHSVSALWNDAFLNTPAKYELTNTIMTYWQEQYYPWNVYPEAKFGHFGRGVEGTIILSDNVETIEGGTFNGCHSLTGTSLPEGLTAIESGTFANCDSLISITIPDAVLNIGSYAFAECSSLRIVAIPCGVTSISPFMCYGCSSLESVILPDSIEYIGAAAFSGCSITYLEIPKSVTVIEDQAFWNCSNLYKITNNSSLELLFGSETNGAVAYFAKVLVDSEGNKTYADSIYLETADGFLFEYSEDRYILVAYVGDEDTVTLPESIKGCSYEIYQFNGAKHVIIPDGVTMIGDYAFSSRSVEGNVLESVTIPDTVCYIGNYAFEYCNIKSISIPDSVIDIGNYAFRGCSKLEKVLLPSNLTYIASGVFSSCSSLKTITIPDTVYSIGGQAFAYCRELREISIPQSVSSIGGSAFAYCDNLQSILIPESVTFIGHCAFPANAEVIFEGKNANFQMLDGILYNSDLTEIVYVDPQIAGEIVLPDTLTTIGDGAFRDCSKMESIIIPSSVTRIDNGAFWGCVGLKSITIPNSVVHIGQSAFAFCENLKSITIPDGVTNIADGLFHLCYDLETVAIPESVTIIGNGVFTGCRSLGSIEIAEGNAYYCFEDGVLYDNPVTKILWVSPCASGDVTILNGVTTVDYFAFADCKYLTSITLPNSVTSIAEAAFSGCTGLENILIPESVASIGVGAFRGCARLGSIDIPPNVTYIGEEAFSGCTDLYEVVNHSALELTLGSEENGYVAYYAKVLECADGNRVLAANYYETDEHFLFTKTDGVYTLIAYLGEQDTITLPESINGHDYVLYYFRGAKNVIIPNGRNIIDSWAFAYCGSLENVTIPDSVTEIGDFAFFECNSLQNIVIPNSVTFVGQFSFMGCFGAKSLTLSDGMNSISNGAFSGCAGLVNVVIPEGVSTIGSSAFSNCYSIQNVSIPASVTYIGEYAFANCDSMYTNPEYYQNGRLVIDGWLIDVDEDGEYLHNARDIKGVVGAAYDNCHLLKNAVWGSASLPSNVETLCITNINEMTPYLQNTLTLKNVVICDTVGISDLRYCEWLFRANNVTGVTIFVEALEEDMRWDDNFPGWNNGNKVVYGDQWHWVNFYDENGALISSEPVRNSQVIRLPILQIAADDQYTYQVIGWDLDGDGEVDNIPATSVVDIEAKPVVQKNLRTYTVTFADTSTGVIYGNLRLPYGATITVPAAPAKQGHDFAGWTGWYEGMTVTGDTVIYASWTHHGSGHEYADPVWVAATCTEPGYYKHQCSICGEYYATGETEPQGHSYQETVIVPTCTEQGYVLHTCTACGHSYTSSPMEPLGHSYGDWITVTAPTCAQDGAGYRLCSICGHSESGAIPADGHSFVLTDLQDSTCEVAGCATYSCTVCQTTVTEELPLKSHNYHKEYAPVSFIQWLIQLLMDILWGYEGDQAYYFVCDDCGQIQSRGESAGASGSTASSACKHTAVQWQTVREFTCLEAGVQTCTCESCGEVLEVKLFGTPTGEHNFVDGLCSVCGMNCYGDVNADGEINGRDVIQLRKYMANFDYDTGLSTVEVSAGADVNGDGEINGRDVILLRKYMANYDYDTGESTVILGPQN